jgi:outer membrane receptor protein involved in Fe transport
MIGPRRLLASVARVALSLPLVAAAVETSPLMAQGSTSRRAVSTRNDPLAREISIALRDTPLAEAIELVARAGGLRIAFSSDELPRGRKVSYTAARVPLRKVLESILDDTRLDAKLGALDQIVLIPRTPNSNRLASLVRRFVQSDAAARTLSSVVVMGNPFGVPSVSVPSTLTVLDARTLHQPGVGRLDQLLRTHSPGLVIWNEGPAALVTRFASIRGVSSFAGNYLKTYIDNIEAAYPLALAPIDPRALDRVELIRGPQGAALYGADANSGVLQIVTSKGTPQDGLRPSILADVSAGSVSSRFGDAVPEGRVSLVASGGTTGVTYSVGGSVSGNAAYQRGGDVRGWNAHIGTRTLRGPLLIEVSARAGEYDAGVPISSALTNDSTRALPIVPGSQRVQQQTVSLTVRWTPARWWEHQLSTGVDNARIDALREPATLYTFPDQSVRRLRGTFTRPSLRYTTRLSTERKHGVKAAVTVSSDPSILFAKVIAAPRAVVPNPDPPLVPIEQRTGGFVTQLELDASQRAFATLGIRSERVQLREGRTEVVGLPSFGMTAVQRVGSWTLRPRLAYGRGLRAPPNAVIIGGIAPQEPGAGGIDPRTRLRAETQRGLEAGLDIARSSRLTLRATWFDQLATDLVAPVLVTDRPTPVTVTSQNLGEITNRGWEVEGVARWGASTWEAWWSLQDSRVRRLADDYEGELQVGDVPLEVPRQSIGATVQYTLGRFTGSVAMSSVGPWINYDAVSLIEAVRADNPRRPLPSLRAFWRRYPSVANADASLTWAFANGSAYVAATNLANVQTAYRNNAILTPGRTVRAGIDLRL